MPYSEQILRDLFETSNVAIWCIEFIEPVDVTLGDNEIVRQVFENDCRWRMCNKAMSNLYRLPDGVDLNQEAVATYFNRTPENESFVRKIIEEKFTPEGAMCIDRGYDGSIIYNESTVRCHIVGNFMHRMFGMVNDLTSYRQAQYRLTQREQDVRSILTSLPDAVLVIDRAKKLLAVNPAFENLFGWSSEEFLGREISSVLDLDHTLPEGRRWYGDDDQRWVANILPKTGAAIACEIQIAPIRDDVPGRFVLSIRPMSCMSAA